MIIVSVRGQCLRIVAITVIICLITNLLSPLLHGKVMPLKVQTQRRLGKRRWTLLQIDNLLMLELNISMAGCGLEGAVVR